jgi:hypothetical protein
MNSFLAGLPGGLAPIAMALAMRQHQQPGQPPVSGMDMASDPGAPGMMNPAGMQGSGTPGIDQGGIGMPTGQAPAVPNAQPPGGQGLGGQPWMNPMMKAMLMQQMMGGGR